MISNGTVAFRGINNANVFANQGTGALNNDRLAFRGANTFRLNGASNTSAAVSQTYTFNDLSASGNSTNYARLEMINGQTAYGNGNLTIGPSGSLLISNTIASVTGLFTNNGAADVVNSTASFNNGVLNAGVFTVRSGIVNGALTNLGTGTLRGNGQFNQNVQNAGTISPGLSVGTLTFNTNLTLTLGGTVQMEINSDLGTNDLIKVGNLFTYSGALIVTDLGSGANLTNGSSFQLFNFGSQSGSFDSLALPSLDSGLTWDTTSLELSGLLRVEAIPEPSTLALVCAGIGLMTIVTHRHCRRPVDESRRVV